MRCFRHVLPGGDPLGKLRTSWRDLCLLAALGMLWCDQRPWPPPCKDCICLQVNHQLKCIFSDMWLKTSLISVCWKLKFPLMASWLWSRSSRSALHAVILSCRYCDDSHLWYEKHTSEVCRRVRRVSFSRSKWTAWVIDLPGSDARDSLCSKTNTCSSKL